MKVEQVNYILENLLNRDWNRRANAAEALNLVGGHAESVPYDKSLSSIGGIHARFANARFLYTVLLFTVFAAVIVAIIYGFSVYNPRASSVAQRYATMSEAQISIAATCEILLFLSIIVGALVASAYKASVSNLNAAIDNSLNSGLLADKDVLALTQIRLWANSGSLDLSLKVAEMQFHFGKTQEAVKILETIEKGNPFSSRLLLLLVQVHYEGDHLKRAQSTAQRILRNDPNHVEAQFFLQLISETTNSPLPSTKKDEEGKSLGDLVTQKRVPKESIIESYGDMVTVRGFDAGKEELLVGRKKYKLTSGMVIGGYHFEECLGEGSFGYVWKVSRDNKTYAAKIPRSQKTIQTLIREPRLLKNVEHANLVRFLGTEQSQGVFMLLMEFLTGGSLRDKLQKEGKLSPQESIKICRQVLSGVLALHRLGVAHRDIKPENILFDAEGNAKICDFGISRLLTAETRGKVDIGGTYLYMSPEQIRGRVTPKSDIWSVGVMLYEMICGEHPFCGDTPFALMSHIVHAPVPKISSLNT
ncbi:serine/threonine-protein kinase [Candidatus Uabimicrobium amorphum]|uniref:Protein kinase n=1 Tax=Uabimicrobium amorphum TaxID=2596890 RepID=A0A5S9IQL3_UABAM|nr:serine/threonine-protein kinase [Candidatus Uabimicrobium amorphum]BBM86298.1 protein kinase [Candidatus Uabimicrobium amorphum]